jgi:hypothetical protein
MWLIPIGFYQHPDFCVNQAKLADKIIVRGARKLGRDDHVGLWQAYLAKCNLTV